MRANSQQCDRFRPLNVPTGPLNDKNATAAGDSRLCKFACQRDCCPFPCVVLVPLAVRFNFIGYDGPQQTAIKDAWKHLVTIGNGVNFNIHREFQVSQQLLETCFPRSLAPSNIE
jgi:hypothetical protein